MTKNRPFLFFPTSISKNVLNVPEEELVLKKELTPKEKVNSSFLDSVDSVNSLGGDDLELGTSLDRIIVPREDAESTHIEQEMDNPWNTSYLEEMVVSLVDSTDSFLELDALLERMVNIGCIACMQDHHNSPSFNSEDDIEVGFGLNPYSMI